MLFLLADWEHNFALKIASELATTKCLQGYWPSIGASLWATTFNLRSPVRRRICTLVVVRARVDLSPAKLARSVLTDSFGSFASFIYLLLEQVSLRRDCF